MGRLKISKKELTFKFFSSNPEVLEDQNRKKYVNELGISKNTYANYKWEYKMLHSEVIENREIQELNKHYNGRLREKFKFDDSKLF